MKAIFLLACWIVITTPLVYGDDVPLPFERVLKLTSPHLVGNDVLILQNLLSRCPAVAAPPKTAEFDDQTAAAVTQFQYFAGLVGHCTVGELDGPTATALLDRHLQDGYVDAFVPPKLSGHLFRIHVSVHANRSIESSGRLIAANGTTVFTFPLRGALRAYAMTHSSVLTAHGQDDVTGTALNMLTNSGNTPTGLVLCDLNTPEPDPKSFGPYNVVRFVKGLAGNCGISNANGSDVFISNIRDGILIHTGEWPGWDPSKDMPNSHGCIHTHPTAMKTLTELLERLGVEARQNSMGKMPYPYTPQGLCSVALEQN